MYKVYLKYIYVQIYCLKDEHLNHDSLPQTLSSTGCSPLREKAGADSQKGQTRSQRDLAEQQVRQNTFQRALKLFVLLFLLISKLKSFKSFN